MAMTGSSDLQAVIEKRVSTMVTTTLIQESVGMGVVKVFPAEAGIDQIKIPLFNELAVQAVTENSEVSPSTVSPTSANLDLDQQKAVAWTISKRAQVQQKINSINTAIENGARSLAADVDDYLFGIMVAGAGSSETLSGDALADIANAKKLMDMGNVQKFDRFLIASPGFIQTLLANNIIQDASKYGTEQPIQAGYVSRVYGFTIVESSSSAIPTNGFIAMQREGCAFSRQINPMLLREEKALAINDEYSLSHLFGAVLTDTGSNRVVTYSA